MAQRRSNEGRQARIEAFYGKATRWGPELRALREILLESPLQEDFKWRSPCYTRAGGNVVTVWALKDAAGLGFFKGVLLRDPAGLLVAPGENSRSTRVARFTGIEEIAAQRDTLAAYLQEAAELEAAGAKVEFPKDDLEMPAELRHRLAADPALRAAFEALTPGRRRGYMLHIGQAKQSATRAGRIDKWAPRILEGKGMHDR